jgi:hypothetical protein
MKTSASCPHCGKPIHRELEVGIMKLCASLLLEKASTPIPGDMESLMRVNAKLMLDLLEQDGKLVRMPIRRAAKLCGVSAETTRKWASVLELGLFDTEQGKWFIYTDRLVGFLKQTGRDIPPGLV